MICINMLNSDILYRLKRNRLNEHNRKWLAANRERHNEQARQYSTRNPEKSRASKVAYRKGHVQMYRDYALKYYYADPEPTLKRLRDRVHGEGATEYLVVQIQKQNNSCAICGKEFVHTSRTSQGNPCLDHNHETGQWRGALCHACNVGIGFLKENREFLQRAIAYLDEWNSTYENSSDHPVETESVSTP